MHKNAVICDACGAVETFSARRTIKEGRAVELNVKGWTTGKSGRVVLDFCPVCSSARTGDQAERKRRSFTGRRSAQLATAFPAGSEPEADGINEIDGQILPPAFGRMGGFTMTLEVKKLPPVRFIDGNLSDMIGEHEEEAR